MEHSKPLMVELFAGLHGWGEGAVAEGFRVVGFDIVDMCKDIGFPRPSGDIQLVLQDVLTLHGSQFKDAALIVASPPCQAYSYRAMPWKRAKALPPPDNSLFNACFRIQREAIEAAGHHIPLVVENVRGAQKWVGRSRWNYGSFHLWGDVPALMPMTKAIKVAGFRFDGSGRSFQSASVKVGGIDFNGYGTPGYKVQAFNTTAEQRLRDGLKGSYGGADGWFGCYAEKKADHIKQHGSGREWFAGDGKISRMTSSKSSARKAASAMIAKIPLPLAIHIARYWTPTAERLTA